ncbi:Serinc-domain containing serine and sphingolipid biosynthesis protein [Zea mays]|uniref:Serinc-domain containing serine and sphingolipid biosynthesis protein n=1 Tax=Zea mays TaxID=4577 RepID=A0A1D6E6I6_MAIZE|nr:Serinc-domain containing serine and sphingolipid biosynthesis protein [Zea mays]
MTVIKAAGAEPCGDGGAYGARRRQSLRARYAYGFVFFATNLLAWFVRDYGARALRGLHHVPVCGAGDSKCFQSGGVLRVSLGCFNVKIFFWVMFATTFGTRKLHEARNSWHSGCWILKSLVYAMSIGIPFIIPNIFIQFYGEVARLGAGIFLLLQLISMLHFISWCNKRWMPDPGSNQCSFLFAEKVNEGLLSSGIMSSYIVFLCWSALHSEPQTGKCHSHMKIAQDGDSATIVFRNDKVQLDEDIPYSYEIFHIVFAMGAMYFAMLFISWELNHPTRKWSIDVGWASTWVKIINEWFAASIYLWRLISPVVLRNQLANEELMPHRPTV